MVKLLHVLILLLYHFPSFAQEPTISWGPEIQQNNRDLSQLHIIGTGTDNSFYTQYTENRQITLERYNQKNQRIWAVAIAPRSPDGSRAVFEQLAVLNHQVYLISSVTGKYKKDVFIQRIDGDGDYMPTIHLLATTTPDAKLYAATKNNWFILVLQQQTAPQQTEVLSYQGSFKPNWRESIPVKGNIRKVAISESGAVYLLTKQPATNSPEAAFYLYRFEGRNGNSSTLAIGSTAQRPLQAELEVLNSDVVVAGITAPAPFVASLNPEPTGTFFYYFPKGRFRKYTLNFSLIDSTFLYNYKAHKPDNDHSQRLRYLHLQHLLPLAGKHTALLGEVYTSGKKQHHFDDILVITFNADGRPVYTTTVNKHQTEPERGMPIGSYMATTAQDTIKLIYLDFENKYKGQNKPRKASTKAVQKTPVLVSILPDGTQNVEPLHNTQTSHDQGFYLRPSSAFRVSEKDYIVLGIGPAFYRFGRMTF